MLEEIAAGQVGLMSIWFLGVSMGMTVCTVTCMPFLGTWALGRASGTNEALTHTAFFLAGRVVAYTVLGAVAGAIGMRLAGMLGGGVANAAIGTTSVLAGLWLLLRPMGRRKTALPTAMPIRIHRTRPHDGVPPLLLGVTLSLAPCAPLASLLALAAHAGTALAGAGYGLAFGLGAAVTPILVLVPLAGRLGRELRVGRAWVMRCLLWGAATVLIVLGLRRIMLAAGGGAI